MRGAVHQIGDRWSLLILWAATRGVVRFEEFREVLGVPNSTLAKRLAGLTDAGIFVRRPVCSRRGLRKVYRLTKRGEALRPALELIAWWGSVEAQSVAGESGARACPASS